MKKRYKILLYILGALLIIRYIIETFTYGTWSQKIFLLFFPLFFSNIGIKELKKKHKAKKEQEKVLDEGN